MNLKNSITSYESYLRIDKVSSVADQMRARGVYLIGWAFIASQIINQIQMSLIYRDWTFDHLISALSLSLIHI